MPRKRKQIPKPIEQPRYPDLAPIVSLLHKRIEENPAENQMQILKKWEKQLLKIQQEIQHLKKLEKFTNNLNSNSRKKETT